jgi:hypothetical protein
MVSAKSALVPNRATLNIGQRHTGDEETMKVVVGRHDVCRQAEPREAVPRGYLTAPGRRVHVMQRLGH